MVQINVAPWHGLGTFWHAPSFHGIHTKNPFRPPIAGTYTEAVALRRDHHKNPGDYLSVGQRVREVYHSCLQFDRPEQQWEFSRILGCGSFGLACLYQKRDGLLLTDEVVAKSETAIKSLAVHDDIPDISKEVFHMAQLSERKDGQGNPRLGIVQLRGYRTLYGTNSTQGEGNIVFETAPGHVAHPLYREWRTFMENCSYGTLTRVILTYKAWGYHIPEAFIWWTFLWLMEACKTMEQNPSSEFLKVENPDSIPPYPGSFMLSNDIKHDNIFLGNPRSIHAPGAPFNTYPAARMGDFGLSRVTRFDHDNRIARFPRGTAVWQAPERRKVPIGFDDNNRNTYLFYKPGRVDEPTWTKNKGFPPNTESHCIGPEANAWGAAMAVWLLMTLEDIRDLDEIVKFKLSHRNETRDDEDEDQYLVGDEGFLTYLSEEEDYSDELKDLVRECTRIEPLKRPNTDTILRLIHEGIEREYDRLQEEFGDDEAIRDATRMAFTNEDWYHVPEGPFNMMEPPTPGVRATDKVRRGWRDLHAVVEEWADPTAPTLVPPCQWRIFQLGDAIPASHTARNPRSSDPLRTPFYGDDWVLYVDHDFIAGYYQGRPLPVGGRARLQSVFV